MLRKVLDGVRGQVRGGEAVPDHGQLLANAERRLEAEASGRDEDAIRDGYERQVSMRTFIDAREIAHMVAFLASPRAAKISGQVISVDGNTETMRTD